MKYIDADKLIAEIERRKADAKLYDMSGGDATIYDELLSIITSLQQDQPELSCKSCGFYENNCPFIRNTFKPYPNRVCKDYTYSVMKEREQPLGDLEKEIEKEWKRCNPIDEGMGVESAYIHIEAFDIIARHFYELGLNARKEE